MKKLALSVVILMVAGAGVSAGAVGCSSSSSGNGGTADSGTGTGTDSSVGDDASGDSGEVADTGTGTDTGTAADSGTACTTDASVVVGVDTDAGFMENTACDTCVNTMCAAQVCPCLTDTSDDAGSTICGDYVGCLYTHVATYVAENPDAGATAIEGQLQSAQTSCGTGVPTTSSGEGNALVGCVVQSCAADCL